MAYTIELLESFDDGASASRLVSGSTGPTTTGARTGTNAYQITGGGFDHQAVWAVSAGDTKGAAFWAYRSAVGDFTSGSRFFNFREGHNNIVHVYLWWNGDDLQVRRGDGTVLGTMSGVRPAAGAGFHVCMWVNVHNSTGAVRVYINRVQVLNLTGIDTQHGGTGVVDHLGFGGSTGSTVYADDVVLVDADSMTDAFALDLQVLTRIVNANGNYSQLLGSDGNSTNNFQQVDDTTPSASDYNASSSPGDKDTYGFADAGVTGNVEAVQISIHALKSGTEAIGYRRLARSGGVDDGGADIVLSNSMALTDEVLMEDPTDDDPWTISKVDGLEVGFEVRAV